MAETSLFRFQPDAMKRETLEKIFVGKQKELLLQKLTKEITRAIENRKQRHYLIIGPRGVGKTHFITLLYYQLKDAAVNASLVKLSEEEFSIYRVSDLLQRIIETLESKKTVFGDFENMSDESVITTAVEELESSGKSIVLFIENLNQVLGEQMNGKEVKRLRSLLQKENLFITVTSAPLVFNQISVHNEPFFNFFEIVYLGELDKDELKELLRRIGEVEKNQKFTEQLSKIEHKINAITTLTGGNPRIAILLYDLTSREKIFDVEKAFFKILDDNTPYYQDIFRMMSGEQRRIFDALIAMRKPATPSEVAKKTRLKQNAVNSQMRRLEKDGYLVSRKFGRITKYEVREKLFRLWRELRKESFGRQRLSILLEFLELWYSAQERETLLLKCFDNIDKPAEKEKMIEAGYWFSSLPYKRKEELLPTLIEKSYKFGETPFFESLILDEKMRKIALVTRIELLLKAGKYEEIVKVINEAEPNVVPLLMTLKASILSHLGRHEEALGTLTKAVELNPQNARSWMIKGDILGYLGRYEEALEASTKAVELNPQNAEAWSIKGDCLGALGRYEEALEASTKAVELNPQNARSWAIKGQALKFLKRYEEALEASTKAVELSPQNARSWMIKGDILGYLGRYEEALEASTKAVELNPQNAEAWEKKVEMLKSLNRDQEALQCLSQSIELHPKSSTLWIKKAEILTKLEKSGAKDAYHKALSLAETEITSNPSNVEAWLNKANALIDLDRFQDASHALLKIAELPLDPDAKKICRDYAALLSAKAYFAATLEEFERKNIGNAEQNLERVVNSLGDIDEKTVIALAKEELARFLNKIADLKNTEALRVALTSLSQTKGFEDFLSLFKLSLDIVETKDVTKFYDVQVEKREIIAGIVEKLSGSTDLLPLEYKKTRKDS